MKLPKYYCPHCKRFKKWYQVEFEFSASGYSGYYRCKHCGAPVEYTLDLLKDFIEQHTKENNNEM